MPQPFPDNKVQLFDPATATAPEWRSLHAFRRARHQVTRPDDPILPDDVVEKQMRRPRPHQHQRRYLVMDDDGGALGYLAAGWVAEGAPNYESNKTFLEADGMVLPAFRGQGIGTALARKTLALMEASGTTVLSAYAEEDAGERFLESLGAEVRMKAAENRLDLRDVDWDMVDDWVRAGAERSPDTAVELHPDRLPESHWEEYGRALTLLLNTIPWDDLDHGEIAVTVEEVGESFERAAEIEAAIHVAFAREPDGSISGLTDVRFVPARPDRVEQMFTGVRPDARGRGLGKLLKASMLQYVRGRYPDVRWITTGNADSNAPMLAINRRLGFKTHRGGAVYQVQSETLRQWLDAKAG